MIQIKKLPSGFWAVFVDGVFVEAALPSEQAAKKYAADFAEKYLNGGKNT